jgi:hypothetical protein
MHCAQEMLLGICGLQSAVAFLHFPLLDPGSRPGISVVHEAGARLARGVIMGILCLAASGCAWMGTSEASHAVRGTLLDAFGRPLAGQQVDLAVPSRFRPHGEEAYFQPENYSRPNDRLASVTTDFDGVFYHLFPPLPYRTALYLLPPVGKFPKHPKKLNYAIRAGGQAYFVGEEHGQFGYRVLTSSGRAVRDSASHVSGVYSLQDGIWELTLTIRQ